MLIIKGGVHMMFHIDYRTSQSLYLQTQAYRAWIFLYQPTTLLKMITDDLKTTTLFIATSPDSTFDDNLSAFCPYALPEDQF